MMKGNLATFIATPSLPFWQGGTSHHCTWGRYVKVSQDFHADGGTSLSQPPAPARLPAILKKMDTLRQLWPVSKFKPQRQSHLYPGNQRRNGGMIAVNSCLATRNLSTCDA